LGIGGVAGHAHKHAAGTSSGYFHAVDVIRNSSGCTGACLLMRREVFEEVGRLDEANLGVAFNDVDLCMRVRERGYLIIYTPHAVLTHYESESRGFDLNPREIDFMLQRWGAKLVMDPYYSPNLTLEHEDFSFDLSKPDGYRVGYESSPVDSIVLELPLRMNIPTTMNALAGLVLFVAEGGLIELGCGDARARAAVEPGRSVVLFDVAVDGRSLTVDVSGTAKLLGSGSGVPAVRALHRPLISAW
jgi:hypothetical protein